MNSVRKNKLGNDFIFTVAAPLGLGSLIYIGFRSKTLLMFKFIEALGISSSIEFVRVQLQDVPLPKWVLYSLPDGCWTLAFTSFVLQNTDKKLTTWLVFPIAMSIGAEIGQWAKLIPGTFDITDLLFCIAGVGLSFLFNKKHNPQLS